MYKIIAGNKNAVKKRQISENKKKIKTANKKTNKINIKAPKKISSIKIIKIYIDNVFKFFTLLFKYNIVSN